MIEWLLSTDARLVPFIQIAASTFLAIASLVVAWAALNTARVNSFGSKPVCFFKSVERDLIEAGAGDFLRVTLEVWNRQKYPVTLRSISLSVEEEGYKAEEGEWRQYDKTLYWRRGELVDGMGHSRFVVNGQAPTEGFHLPACKAAVTYYDPMRNKDTTIEAMHQYVRASPLAIEKYSWEWVRRIWWDGVKYRLMWWRR